MVQGFIIKVIACEGPVSKHRMLHIFKPEHIIYMNRLVCLGVYRYHLACGLFIRNVHVCKCLRISSSPVLLYGDHARGHCFFHQPCRRPNNLLTTYMYTCMHMQWHSYVTRCLSRSKQPNNNLGILSNSAFALFPSIVSSACQALLIFLAARKTLGLERAAADRFAI